MAFLSEIELQKIGFKYIGNNVRLSDRCSIYNPSNIEIGSNTRIDDFCILSAGMDGIKIGSYVHIACYCSLIGQGLIELKDFVGLSSRGAIYSSNDDYSGNYMTGPCVPSMFTNVKHGKVLLEKHVIIGVGSVILPGVTIGYGCAVGAFSLISKDVEELTIVAGAPVKFIKKRSRGFEEKERELLNL